MKNHLKSSIFTHFGCDDGGSGDGSGDGSGEGSGGGAERQNFSYGLSMT